MKPQVKIVENDAGWEYTVKSPRGNTKTFMVGRDGAFDWDQAFMMEWSGYRHCSLCQGTGKFAVWDQAKKLRTSSWCDCFQKQFFHIFPVSTAKLILNHIQYRSEKDQAVARQAAEKIIEANQNINTPVTPTSEVVAPQPTP